MILFKQVLKFSLIFLVSQLLFAQISYGQSTGSERPEAWEMLEKMAEAFKNKIGEQFSVAVQFDISDKEESWYVTIEEGRKVSVGKTAHKKAQFIFVITTDTLLLIYEGKMTAMTAAGKAKGSDPAPLDLKFAEGMESTPEIRKKFYTFIQHFFNPTEPERILLGEEYSRVVHGGHVIPLYYHPGLRSGWYLLKKGERLNEPGDTNPFPQAFIFIQGEGFAKIGDKTIRVKAGESYFIPPGSDHVVWTESKKPLILIWLAWGEGA